ncbi:protein kinase domain-containing protein [Kitasatospora sp. McL0602]|uniref:serine/threonine-protein kinase n=1 Tax=Kitasatospora sp. McL0602 TaxID=3439530 RepID=UPI003F88F7B1
MGVQEQSAQAGRRLAGRYALGDRLGRGGMGTVWRARDEMLDRDVAVKELTVGHLDDEDQQILQSRMMREARAAARIKHPGVITIHDVLEQDGRPWIVMELIDGRSLADVISQDGTLLPREAAEVGQQVLAALHRGHQLGVLHRDVKPANVLLEHQTGRVVLLDFGIATFEGSTELTRPGDLIGSPDYLAPERAQGERPGPASDLWGLGATLYAAVEGESPFRRTSPLTTLAAVVADPLPEPRRAGALGPVLAALMAKDPAERPSADEAQRMLAEVTAGHTMDIKPLPKVEPVEPVEPAVPSKAALSKAEPKIPTQLVPVVDRAEPVTPVEPEPVTVQGVPAAPAAPVALDSVTGPVVRRGGRKRRLGLLAGLLALVVAAGGAYVVVTRHKDTTGQGSGGVTATDSPAPGATEPGAAPAGYRWMADEEGFRFPLPVTGGTWVRSMDKNQIFYTPDNKLHFLQFAVAVGQPLAPSQHLEQLEGDVSKGKNIKDFHRVDLSEVRINGQEGAFWEFTYTVAKDGSHRHVREAEFRDEDGTSYTIYQSGPEADSVDGQRLFTTVLNKFTVTR